MKLGALALRLSLLALSIVFTALVGEIVVRLAAPQQLIIERPDIWYPVDGLGWQKRPHVDTEINTGERTVRLRTDEHGFRVGEDGRFRADTNVLLLGDSFMEAIQVEYEDSVAGRLESALSRETGARVAVWNTGVSGWGPSHYFIQAVDLLDRQAFDLVLVAVYLGNDAETKLEEHIPPRDFVETHSLRWPREPSWNELVSAVLWPVNDYLERRSHLFQLLKVQLRVLLMRLGLSARYFPSELVASPEMEAAWRGTASTLRALADRAAAHGVPTRIVVLPSHYQLDARALDRYLIGFDAMDTDVDVELPNRLLAEAARAQGLALIDATPALRAAYSEGKPVYGRVDTHLSPDGHAVVAALLTPELVRALGAPVAERDEAAELERRP